MTNTSDSLLFVDIDLEADDVSILDLALRKGELGLHQLDHARFDFLRVLYEWAKEIEVG